MKTQYTENPPHGQSKLLITQTNVSTQELEKPHDHQLQNISRKLPGTISNIVIHVPHHHEKVHGTRPGLEISKGNGDTASRSRLNEDNTTAHQDLQNHEEDESEHQKRRHGRIILAKGQLDHSYTF